jgi:hypothetical protein
MFSEDNGIGGGEVEVEAVGDVDPDARVDGGGDDEHPGGEEADEKAVSCSIMAICFVGVRDGFASIWRRRNFPDVPRNDRL